MYKWLSKNAIKVHLVFLQQRFQDLLAPSILSRVWQQEGDVCCESFMLWNGWHMHSASVSCIHTHIMITAHHLQKWSQNSRVPVSNHHAMWSLTFAMLFADSTCPGWAHSCWGIAKLVFAACQQWPRLPVTILMILRNRNNDRYLQRFFS